MNGKNARYCLEEAMMNYLGVDSKERYVYDNMSGRCLVSHAYSDRVDVYDGWNDETQIGDYVETTDLYHAVHRFVTYVMYPFRIEYDE